MADDVSRRLDRLAEVCLAPPEPQRSELTGQHTAFTVRQKIFAHHLP